MEQDMEADKRLLGTSHVEILFYHFVVFSLKKLRRFSKSNIISVWLQTPLDSNNFCPGGLQQHTVICWGSCRWCLTASTWTKQDNLPWINWLRRTVSDNSMQSYTSNTSQHGFTISIFRTVYQSWTFWCWWLSLFWKFNMLQVEPIGIQTTWRQWFIHGNQSLSSWTYT